MSPTHEKMHAFEIKSYYVIHRRYIKIGVKSPSRNKALYDTTKTIQGPKHYKKVRTHSAT